MKNSATDWDRVFDAIDKEFQINTPADWKRRDILELQEMIRSRVNEAIAADEKIARYFADDIPDIEKFVDSTVEERRKIIARQEMLTSKKKQRPFGNISYGTLLKIMSIREMSPQKKIADIFTIFSTGKLNNYDSANTIFKNLSGHNRYANNQTELDLFANSHWKGFYFKYDEEQKKGFLGMVLLHIKNPQKIHLRNNESETSTSYEGFMCLEKTEQHVTFDLVGKPEKKKKKEKRREESANKKHLRITLHIGTTIDKLYPIYLGVYTNNYSNNSLVAGTIILEKTENKKLTPLECDFKEWRKYKIDPAIASYLYSRSFNFIKAPSGLFTKPKLSEWLSEKKIKIIRPR